MVIVIMIGFGNLEEFQLGQIDDDCQIVDEIQYDWVWYYVDEFVEMENIGVNLQNFYQDDCGEKVFNVMFGDQVNYDYGQGIGGVGNYFVMIIEQCCDQFYDKGGIQIDQWFDICYEGKGYGFGDQGQCNGQVGEDFDMDLFNSQIW